MFEIQDGMTVIDLCLTHWAVYCGAVFNLMTWILIQAPRQFPLLFLSSLPLSVFPASPSAT